MKSYQKSKEEVNETVNVLDPERLREKAAGGLLALSIELGLDVMRQMFEMDVEEIAGKKGKHNPNRNAYRHGNEWTKVVLGGEKRSVEKPRVRGKDGTEHTLPSLAFFQNEDPLTNAVLGQLLRGVSTRKYAGSMDYFSRESACVSKSEVSRIFIAGLEPLAAEFLSRRLDDDYPAVMIDGMSVGSMTVLAAMGIRMDGTKQMLGLIEGASENSIVANTLLADLIDRGLNPGISRLFTLDGSKALHKAVTDTFGENAVIQRCQVHKKRNVLNHLPESEQGNAGLAMSRAYMEHKYEDAKRELEQIAASLNYRYPSAAKSLLEGLEETLTVHRLELPALLRQTLCTTNPMESANSVCMGVARRVKNWKDGGMILRYIAAGYMEAEKGFRRIKGYRQIPVLTSSLNRQKDDQTDVNVLSA